MPLIDNEARRLRDVLAERLDGVDVSIASGFLELGALLALDGDWQRANGIRLLFGGETSFKSKRAFEQGISQLRHALNESAEAAKRQDPFLLGLPAVINALAARTIQARVYRKARFHAKATLCQREEVLGTIGSSNFTVPGLSSNTELNVDLDPDQAAALNAWYERHWKDAEDVTEALEATLRPHAALYTPYEVYLRSLQAYLARVGLEPDEWDRTKSEIFPKLAGYQRRGYLSMLLAAERWGGAFLCDGVGSGKTFVGLMLIERLVRQDRKKVALFVPKVAKASVWEPELARHLPGLQKGYDALKVFSHTDLGREAMREELEAVRDQADVVIIDEAHHFRNRGLRGEGSRRRSRYWEMFELSAGKTVYLLTATPINNSLLDFQHMVELFSRERRDHFASAPLGIHSLRGYIRDLDRAIQKGTEGEQDGLGEVDAVGVPAELDRDPLFRALVTQRSRADIIASMREEDGNVLFPRMRPPQVANYNVTQTYGRLLRMVETAFNKAVPLFTLALYAPDEYAYDPLSVDDFTRGRRAQVVSLIRTSFLKRFESSAEAFRQSCENLLRKLLAWSRANAQTPAQRDAVESWVRQHGHLVGADPQDDLFDEDYRDPLLDEDVEVLDPAKYDIARILRDTGQDITQIAEFLGELARFKPSQDKKLAALVRLLKTDPVISRDKVLIFTEFATTGRYLDAQLRAAGIEGVEEIDGSSGNTRSVVQRFAPYYNKLSSAELASRGEREIRVLIATDILSEGLNLQDATRLINYDLHWNPVRLMQRIGRVDRRLNQEVEDRIAADHPERAASRGEVAYWNFLPPDELDILLRLYQRVAHKTLRISRTLGIEHGRLLREDDDYEVVKTFERAREGQRSPTELLRSALQVQLAQDPELEERLARMPLQVFTGREKVSGTARAVFFCYARPAYRDDVEEWSDEAGDVAWLLYDLQDGTVFEDASSIHDRIACSLEEPRVLRETRQTLLDAKAAVERHLTQTYLRRVQAPAGVACRLLAWMELN